MTFKGLSLSKLFYVRINRKEIVGKTYSVNKVFRIAVFFILLSLNFLIPKYVYGLNSVREITYKNVNTVLTKEDIDLKGGSYVFSGLTDTLPYTLTEDDLGTDNLTVYDGQEMRTVKIVVTDASREVDRDGWTIIEPSSDSRIIYVSESEGDDKLAEYYKMDELNSDDPRKPDLSDNIKPFRTISAALNKARDGYPDWVLFKKGDVWNGEYEPDDIDDPNTSCIRIDNSGRSLEESRVISSYGYGKSKERPKLNFYCLRFHFSIDVSHVIFAGLDFHHFRAVVSNPKNILVEDCNTHRMERAYDYIFQGLRNLELRRNIIATSRPDQLPNATAYFSNNRGLLLEENRLHNFLGKETENVYDQRNMFYIQRNNSDVGFYRNIVTDSLRHGAQVRPGGIVLENIFARHQHPLFVGPFKSGEKYRDGNIVRDNVVLESRPRNPNNWPWHGGFGFEIHSYASEYNHEISNNIIFIPDDVDSGVFGIRIGAYGNDNIGMYNTTIENNIIYNWPRSIYESVTGEGVIDNLIFENNLIQSPLDRKQSSRTRYLIRFRHHINFSGNTWFHIEEDSLFSDPETGDYVDWEEWQKYTGETGCRYERVEFEDTQRNLGTYQEMLKKQEDPNFKGYDQGLPWPDEGMRAFIDISSQQSRDNWNWNYSPVKILEYFQEGFTIFSKPESIKILGPEQLEIPVSGKKSRIYRVEIKDENNNVLEDEPYIARIVGEPYGVSLSGTRLTVTPRAEPGDIEIEVELDENDKINDSITVKLLYDKTAPDEILPDRSFVTPSYPELKFGEGAKEVLITDIRGNEVFSSEKGSSRFIIWAPGEGGTVSIESGIYIYRIKTKDGYEYGSVVVAK